MSLLVLLLCAVAGFVFSLLLTSKYRRFALINKIVDKPNSRSSHTRITPRGAGVSFILCFLAISAVLTFNQLLAPEISLPLLSAGLMVALLGFWDDMKPVKASIRLFIHLLAAVFLVALLSAGFSNVISIPFLIDNRLVSFVFCILFISWFINLYNFMDGCDGLAGGVGAVSSLLLGTITTIYGSYDLGVTYFTLSFCLGGFIVYNWSPALVFMGDSGAYFLGYTFSSLALVSKLYNESFFYVHLIILGALIVDASWTLVLRIYRLEKIFHAHKMHGFQKLMAKGWSHKKVSRFYIAITLFWLFPIAFLTVEYPEMGFVFLTVAYLPLIVFMIFIKAGRLSS